MHILTYYSLWCWLTFYIDDLSSELTSGAKNNLANAGSGLSSAGLGAIATNMNIIDNRPPPPPHSNLLHMSGNLKYYNT